MKRFSIPRAFAVTALLSFTSVSQAASTAPVAAENGMVVTAQHLATRVGVDVLKKVATRWMRRWRSATRWPWCTRRRATWAAAGS